MHATTIRFSDDLYDLVAATAKAEGSSVAAYVRESVLIRFAMQRAWTASAASSAGSPGASRLADLVAAVQDALAAQAASE